MHGKVSPGYYLKAQERPSSILCGLTKVAAEQGRIVVDPEQAAAHVLVANIGVTLRQIILAEVDPQLSDAVRDGVIAAITGAAGGSENPIAFVSELATAHPEILGEAETQLLACWLGRLKASC